MKRIIIVLLLLGVITVEGKPKYRIQTWVYDGTTYYLPQQRVWYKTNYFYLPFKVWKSGSYPFQHKSQAEDIINNWKNDLQAKREYRNSRYIFVE
jgi:uncharacterized protein YxeA